MDYWTLQVCSSKGWVIFDEDEKEESAGYSSGVIFVVISSVSRNHTQRILPPQARLRSPLTGKRNFLFRYSPRPASGWSHNEKQFVLVPKVSCSHNLLAVVQSSAGTTLPRLKYVNRGVGNLRRSSPFCKLLVLPVQRSRYLIYLCFTSRKVSPEDQADCR